MTEFIICKSQVNFKVNMVTSERKNQQRKNFVKQTRNNFFFHLKDSSRIRGKEVKEHVPHTHRKANKPAKMLHWLVVRQVNAVKCLYTERERERYKPNARRKLQIIGKQIKLSIKSHRTPMVEEKKRKEEEREREKRKMKKQKAYHSL